MESWSEIVKMVAIDTELIGNLAVSMVVILVIWLIRKITLRMASKRYKDIRTRYQWRKTSAYVSFIAGILLVGLIWFEVFKTIATFLGLISAGLAIALRDPVVNFAGWIFIVWRRPFEVGDRIQIGDHAGDVIDLRIFQFTLMEIGNWVNADQSTGRVIHIPNGKIFTEIQANYSKGFQYIWNEIPVLITFESNWKAAKKTLLRIAKKHAEHLSESAERRVKRAARKFLIYYTKLTPTVYTSVRDSGVLLTIRYLTEPRERRGSEQDMWEDILKAFARRSDIDFAYPTQRFYNNLTEGKDKKEPPRDRDET
jgi:small-conductance mechanosensitive channel